MKLCNVRTVLFFLFSTRLYFDMVKPEIFYSMPGLKELCPYSHFCRLNASREYIYNDDRMPCCQSCSCTTDCGHHGTCCFNRLDEYTNLRASMICKNTFEIDPEQNENYNKYLSEAVPHYWIVNRCNLSTDESGHGHAGAVNNTDTSFSPVFSKHTGLVYFNTFLARCNNVSDIIPWQRLLSCPTNAVTSLTDILDNDIVSPTSENCFFFYSPPETEVDFIQCYTNVIRKCNVTGVVTMVDEYWPLCEKFNSTFIITLNSKYLRTYANVYCYLCNTNIIRENIVGWERSIGSEECNRFGETGHKNPIMSSAALTIILNINQKIKTPILNQKDQCGPNSRIVRSFNTSCRSTKCPSGQILFNGECDFHSKKWIGGPFVVMLRLTPNYKDAYLQPSTLVNLLTRNKYDKRARWIRRNSLRPWYLTAFYHPIRNMSYVEYITIKAVYPLRSVNPKFLIESVKKALQDIWTIEHMNNRFNFKVQFNEYETYSIFEVPENYLENVTIFGFYPHLKTSCQQANIADFDYNHIIYSVIQFSRFELNEGIFLTKMFLCNQVELLPEEFEFSPPSCVHNIFFTVKNLTMHKFIALQTIDHPEPYLPLKSFNRVFVCLHEFGEIENENAGLLVNAYNLILLFAFKIILV